MKSTKDIYALTQKAIPDMTVRRFSRYCGKVKAITAASLRKTLTYQQMHSYT